MQDLGGKKIEKVDSEEKLLAAVAEALTFEDLRHLVDEYNTLFDKSYRGGLSVQQRGGATLAPGDRVIARVQFKDCDAWITQRNRITALDRKEKMKLGDNVKVERTGGEVETGWQIESIDDENLVTVRKGTLTKEMPYQRLLEMNTGANWAM